MFFFYSGTDTEKIRAAVQQKLRTVKGSVVRVTDAHTTEDFKAAFQGKGMFGETQVVVFEHVLQHADMNVLLLDSLEVLKNSDDVFIVVEEKVDAATRKRIEKYAEESDRYDAKKNAADNTAFDMANALQRGDKKNLWVSYMRELGKGSSPEMLHGILFWAAKQSAMKANGPVKKKAEDLIIALVELPHEARRRGVDMEYALERFVLSFT